MTYRPATAIDAASVPVLNFPPIRTSRARRLRLWHLVAEPMLHWDKDARGQLSLWVKEKSQGPFGGQDWPDARSG